MLKEYFGDMNLRNQDRKIPKLNINEDNQYKLPIILQYLDVKVCYFIYVCLCVCLLVSFMFVFLCVCLFFLP